MTALIFFAGGFAACLVCVVLYIAFAGGGALTRDRGIYLGGFADGLASARFDVMARARHFVAVSDDPMPATDLLTLLELDMSKDNQ